VYSFEEEKKMSLVKELIPFVNWDHIIRLMTENTISVVFPSRTSSTSTSKTNEVGTIFLIVIHEEIIDKIVISSTNIDLGKDHRFNMSGTHIATLNVMDIIFILNELPFAEGMISKTLTTKRVAISPIKMLEKDS